MNKVKIHDRRTGPVEALPRRRPGFGANGRPRLYNQMKDAIAAALRRAAESDLKPTQVSIVLTLPYAGAEPKCSWGPSFLMEEPLRRHPNALARDLPARREEQALNLYVLDGREGEQCYGIICKFLHEGDTYETLVEKL